MAEAGQLLGFLLLLLVAEVGKHLEHADLQQLVH